MARIYGHLVVGNPRFVRLTIVHRPETTRLSVFLSGLDDFKNAARTSTASTESSTWLMAIPTHSSPTCGIAHDPPNRDHHGAPLQCVPYACRRSSIRPMRTSMASRSRTRIESSARALDCQIQRRRSVTQQQGALVIALSVLYDFVDASA